MSYTLHDIARVLGSTASLPQDIFINHLAIDSRKITFPPASVFFALESAHNDGHHFIGSAYQQGVRSFVVSKDVPVNDFPGAHFIKVQNSIIALQQLAAFHRKQFSFPVIGITGSNGKTVVKEWLFQLLNNRYNIVRSPKSYNSQVGVPLSLWQMDASNNLGIFEAGISRENEMDALANLIQPGFGIFTFLGDAHAEGFPSKQAKAREKLKLFTNASSLLYCADETVLHEAVLDFRREVNPAIRLLAWGKKSNNVFCITEMASNNATALQVVYNDKRFSFDIAFTDKASIHNACTAICAALHLGLDAVSIQSKLLQLRPVAMRLEIKQGINHCAIINDSYSADLNSLEIALDFLQQQQQHPKHTIIISDMLQSGEAAGSLYNKIAALLVSKNIQKMIGVGPQITLHAPAFSTITDTYFFPGTDECIQAIPALNFYEETILLKGARVFGFEKISLRLEQKVHQTFLEINLNALRNNIRVYRSMLNPGVQLMCMVKAFSYGSGSHEIASLLQHAGVNYLGVAYADEGVELRKAGISLPIMVMNAEEAGFENIVLHQLEPELYSFAILKAFISYLRQQNMKGYPVHIKVDTGMHRLGFESNDIPALCSLLSNETSIRIKSVFSHLAAAGEKKHDEFTNNQHSILLHECNEIEKALGYSFMRHIANTAAIYRHPQLQMNMVRLGIGLYGIDENEQVQKQLQAVATLKTTISQLKHLQPGDSVGYSRSAVVQQPTTIATVRIGYADGYPRLLSNGRGYMMLHGYKAPVIGKVCMDMTMIDVTGIDAMEEDEVLVFGDDLPVSQLAEAAQTISYEILTSISQRVRRVYYEE